ncbi:restriction endonuclease subunit S [Isoptericola haloaureus]|uniref:Restriction endonuclease subunit S n=1 Tax=Isoptericola haloaureus TaxID=1542902 RepID=A0ABU7Z8C0_9MICO
MRPNIKLGDLIEVQRGQSYKSVFIGEPGPFLLGLGTIERNGGFRGDNLRPYGGPTPGHIRLEPGDLYASLKDVTHAADLLGAVARVPKHVSDARLTQDTVRLDLVSERVDRDFLYWHLRSPRYRAYCRSLGTGTTNLDLSRNDFFGYRFWLPDRGEQRAIADVLGALDDKIAANTKLVTTADDLLAAYLDFYLARSRTELVALHDVAELNPDKRTPISGGRLRYVDIASVGVGRLDWPDESSWDDAPGRARRGVRWGDIVWSTVRPNRRSHALILSEDQRLVVSTGLAVFRADHGRWPYLYEVLRRPEFTTYLEGVAEGSAYPAVKVDRIGAASIPWLAEDEALDEFDAVAGPLRARVAEAERENVKLAATRDALLPALMSGRLRVEEAAEVADL